MTGIVRRAIFSDRMQRRSGTDASSVFHTEKSLVGRAAELRKDLEETVQDVAGLFAKIGTATRLSPL